MSDKDKEIERDAAEARNYFNLMVPHLIRLEKAGVVSIIQCSTRHAASWETSVLKITHTREL